MRIIILILLGVVLCVTAASLNTEKVSSDTKDVSAIETKSKAFADTSIAEKELPIAELSGDKVYFLSFDKHGCRHSTEKVCLREKQPSFCTTVKSVELKMRAGGCEGYVANYEGLGEERGAASKVRCCSDRGEVLEERVETREGIKHTTLPIH
ncbi:hypothetical protein OSTOST_20518 [Ostertagia ostertagi]